MGAGLKLYADIRRIGTQRVKNLVPELALGLAAAPTGEGRVETGRCALLHSVIPSCWSDKAGTEFRFVARAPIKRQ